MQYSKKEKFRIVKKICNEYRHDINTIESCCKKQGIPYRTFKDWMDKDSKLAELYKISKSSKRKNNSEKLVKLARTALEKKLNFHEYEETITTKVGKSKKKVKTRKRVVVPTAADIALALNNLDVDFEHVNEFGKDLSKNLESVAKAMRKRDRNENDSQQGPKKKVN